VKETKTRTNLTFFYYVNLSEISSLLLLSNVPDHHPRLSGHLHRHLPHHHARLLLLLLPRAD
jgi:hypothetical protein